MRHDEASPYVSSPYVFSGIFVPKMIFPVKDVSAVCSIPPLTILDITRRDTAKARSEGTASAAGTDRSVPTRCIIMVQPCVEGSRAADPWSIAGSGHIVQRLIVHVKYFLGEEEFQKKHTNRRRWSYGDASILRPLTSPESFYVFINNQKVFSCYGRQILLWHLSLFGVIMCSISLYPLQDDAIHWIASIPAKYL
jgi:hypothetical protein